MSTVIVLGNNGRERGRRGRRLKILILCNVFEKVQTRKSSLHMIILYFTRYAPRAQCAAVSVYLYLCILK